MPICQNCYHQWTWKESVRRLFRLKCPNCGVQQYQSARSKKKTSILNIVPILIIFIVNLFFSWTIVSGSLLLIVLLVVMLGTYPFLLELSNEEEFLF